MKKKSTWFLLVGLVALVLVGCVPAGSTLPAASKPQQAHERAMSREAYAPIHDLEFSNYNRRQVIADDVTTVLWCTAAFDQPGAPLFTIPILGKLTSGAKRPYPTEIQNTGGDFNKEFYPERPGPDGMYGSSGEYRYGFDPAGSYHDFYGMELYCTNVPTVFQREATTIVMAVDPALMEAQKVAQQMLADGDPEGARRALEAAIGEIE